MKYLEDFSLWVEESTGIDNEIFLSILLTLLSFLIFKIVKVCLKNILMIFEQKKAYHYYQICNIVLTSMNVIIIFILWDKFLDNIITIISFISAALTLALRELIFNFFAGIYIKIKKPFVIEDRIEVNGIKGDVINISTLNFDRIDCLANLLVTLSYSNSGEIRKCRAELANQLINLENPKEKLERIEDIFLANNLPTVGKVFLVFQTLYPDFRGFDFSEDSKVSPILKSKTNRSREVIIFSDLLKTAFGSNNRSIKSYLENIENGYRKFLQIQNKFKMIEFL